MKTTLGDIRNSRIPLALGIPDTDARLAGYINEAIMQLLPLGKWVGTWMRYNICVGNGCITWPREIETIESYWLCKTPRTIRNQWFESYPHIGLKDGGSPCGNGDLFDDGQSCTFNDMIGVNEKIKVYADVAEAVGARILLQGKDDNGNWIRTQDAGVWIDGEYVNINAVTPQTSVNFFSCLTAVKKPITNSTIRLYAYDTVLLTQRAIAVYEYDETNPVYRRSKIPGLSSMGACCGAPAGCTDKIITVMAKLRFLPVSNDNDWLIIGNIAALKDACLAVKKKEEGMLDLAQTYFNMAKTTLQMELAQYMGDGTQAPLKMVGADLWGSGGGRNVLM